MKKTFLFLVIMAIGQVAFMQTLSPTVVSNAGAAHENAAAQISWTLGEVMTEAYSNDDLTLSQGFNQHRYEVEPVNTQLTSKESIRVYPVPASDYIQVDYVSPKSVELQAVLFNTEGEKVLQRSYQQETFKMNLKHLPPAIYILKMYNQNNRLIQSTKIIKE
ncbi:MAG: T9SS type A sorting domain-containing protein [Bacteroidetes bacterium]|jgi:hypothetical protein|nr:T9SS type A sorting domain-containing protein [Bacteroidota bacterium]